MYYIFTHIYHYSTVYDTATNVHHCSCHCAASQCYPNPQQIQQYNYYLEENIGFNKNKMNSVVVKCYIFFNSPEHYENVLTSPGDNTLALYVPNPKDFYEHNN